MKAALLDFKISPMDEEALSRLNAISHELDAGWQHAVPEIAIHSEIAVLEKDWRSLEDADAMSLHQSFDWCRAWVETQNPELAIVTGRLGKKVAFILPLEIIRSRAGRIARFIASPQSNINTGLFSAAFAKQATPEIMRAIANSIKRTLAGRVDVIHLSNMPAVWRGTANPFALLPSIENQNHTFQLPLLGSFEETLAQINAKRKRKNFRSSNKKLNALGGYAHVTAHGPEEKQAFLDEFFRQKAIRFQTLGLPNVFREKKTQAFFETLAASSAEDNNYRLRLHAIRMNDGPLAALAGLSRKGDHIICQFVSMDEKIAPDTSPGELLFYLMIEQANADGVALFDFGIGDQRHKRSWCPVETEHRDILFPVSFRGRIGVLSLAAITCLKSFVKGNRLLYRTIQRHRAGKDI